MPLVTDTTQIKLISKLSGTSTFNSSDIMLLQRGFKSYKFNYGDLVSALPDDSTLEASSNTLRVKDSGITTSKINDNSITLSKLDNINSTSGGSDGKVIGRIGGTGDPVLLNVYDDSGLSPDSSTALATQQSIKAYVDSEIGDITATPYYNVIVHNSNLLSSPSDFESGTILIEYKLPSYGSIQLEKNDAIYDTNSVLFTMNVESNGTNNITMKIFTLDDNVYIFDNEVLVYSKASGGFYSSTGESVSFNLSSGSHTIDIVYNDSGGTNQYLTLIGDIIKSGVTFVEA